MRVVEMLHGFRTEVYAEMFQLAWLKDIKKKKNKTLELENRRGKNKI